jgi:hypothetical protein
MVLAGTLISLLAAIVAWTPAESPDVDPIATVCFRVGEPIEMRFVYSGDIEDWDAFFFFDTEADPPLVRLGASAVFVLSKGIGPFESRGRSGKPFYKSWELLEAPRGIVVAPKNESFGRGVAFNVVINDPLDEVVDLTQYFELGEPGFYTLLWGCQPNHVQEIVFEVVP